VLNIKLEYELEQRVIDIGNVKLGGQPGENPPAMIGTVFYANHAALLDEKTAKIDKKLVEQELNEFIEIIEDTEMQGIIDIVGSYPEALTKECEYVSEIVDVPFLVDGLNDDIRIPAMEGLKEIGLLNRAILNSIDETTSDENLKKLKEIGVKNAVLLTFGSRYIFPQQKLEFLEKELIPKAQKADIDNYIIDTAVLDLPSIGINVETIRLIKENLGLPAGFAPANAIYGWKYVKKYGDIARCGAIAAQMAYCINAGSDFVLYGPIKFAKCVIPAISLITGINTYYRKRILRKKISEKTPLNKIF
jgi:tetrahydromethanopterin S-methyltransferase subunit H